MKKIPLLALASLIAITSFAQKSSKKPKPCDCLSIPRHILMAPIDTTKYPTTWETSTYSGDIGEPIFTSFSLSGLETWLDKGVSVKADTLTITGNKITHIVMNGELYIVTPGDIDIRSAFDPAGAKKVIDSVYATPTFILRVRR